MRKSLLIRLVAAALLAAAIGGLAFAKELPPICRDKEALAKAEIEISLICTQIAVYDALADVNEAYAKHLQQQIDALGAAPQSGGSAQKPRADDK